MTDLLNNNPQDAPAAASKEELINWYLMLARQYKDSAPVVDPVAFEVMVKAMLDQSVMANPDMSAEQRRLHFATIGLAVAQVAAELDD
ncbi:MAG: hypothetical protein HQK56_16665 [Deltaproteobacteria bacterium]|nr:hypothetical protein [Deltaproteobacteria bacterium]